MLKKILKALFALMFCTNGLITPVTTVHALEASDVPSDGLFHVVDFEYGSVLDGTYETFKEAKSAYTSLRDDYINLGIVKDGVIYEAEYALAFFKTDDACTYEVTYNNSYDGSEASINGCYGVDAAYLYTDDDGAKITFEISGVQGQANLEDVTVVPLQNVHTRMTMYLVQNGRLYHMIKSEMEDDYYSYIIDQGTALDYLTEDQAYYSYDGHYFYSDDNLYGMLDDYRLDQRTQSVNADNPYYNYYQFVSHRTLTNIRESEIESYFYETGGITGPITSFIDNDKDSVDDVLTSSQYYGILPVFYQSQYQYGTNASMLLAVSINESDNGRSSLAYSKNILFSKAAYDNEEEANASRYLTLENGVLCHAKYDLSGSYLSPMKGQFQGGFFGNKSAGMNVQYSSDPYWGEKAASAYQKLDEATGSKDLNYYRIGIRTQATPTRVYASASQSEPLYDTGECPDMAFIILGEEGDYYKIQSEATLDENGEVDLSYYYNYTTDIGYIQKEDIDIFIGADSAPEETYVNVTFEGNSGTFAQKEETITYQLRSGEDAYCVAPELSRSLFTGWDMDTTNITEDITYTAQYAEVETIELTTPCKTDYELDDRLDLSEGILTVRFSDGSSQEVPLTTSMVKGFDLSVAGEQVVTIHYAGCETTFTITVDEEADALRAQIKEEILNLIDKYGSEETLSDAAKEEILAVKEEMDANMQPYMTQSELRSFDTLLRTAYEDSILYIIRDNTYELGVSGLSVSIPLDPSDLTKTVANRTSYYVNIADSIQEASSVLMEKQANVLGNTVLDTFTISMEKDLEPFESDGPFVFTIARPVDSSGSEVYTVLTVKDDGSVVKCYTRQTTNTISFMSDGLGEFMLTSKITSNQYVGNDPIETVTEETSSMDVRMLIASIVILVLIIVALIYGLIQLNHHSTVKKRTTARKVNRKRIAEEEENLEVTQAIQILNTEMIRLDEIRAAEEKAKKEAEKKKNRYDKYRRRS